MAQLLSTNVAGNLSVTGLMTANGSPMNSLNTSVQTGLANFLSTNAQTTGVLAATNVLSVFLNEPGMYEVEGMLILGTTGTANLLNIGANIAFMNSGSFHYNKLYLSYTGYANTVLVVSNKLISNANAQTAISSNIANASNQSDFITITGVINVSAAGLAQTQICAQNTTNGNLVLLANSFIQWTKIG